MARLRQSMRCRCVFTLFVLFLAASAGSFMEAGVQEYCQWQSFNASCPDTNSLIVMSTAHYGRMRLGRCIDTDFQIGCAADVLLLVDSRCSGRPNCVIPLPDNTLHHQQPCNKDMMAYLEASYTCITVSDAETKSCVETGSIQLQHDEGYLASYTAQSLGHGTTSCPWVITVQAGQKIRLTLMDFSISSRYRGDANSKGAPPPPPPMSGNVKMLTEHCHLYATVYEQNKLKKQNICAEIKREQVAYTSITNSISIEVADQIIVDDSVSFLIRFSATGCADPVVPKNAWAERSDDKVTVKCNQTSQSWHLVCKGVAWIGKTTECQEDYPVGEKVVDETYFPASGLVIAIVIGVFVGSFCGFLLLAIVLWCKRQVSPRYDPEVELVAPSGESDHMCKVHRLPTGEYGYTHVWEVRNTELPMPMGPSSLQRSTDTRSMTTQDSAYQTSAGSQSLNVNPSGLAAALHGRKEHVYECPIFDERFLLQRLQNYPHHCPHDSSQRAVFCPHGRGGFSSPAAVTADQSRSGVASPTERGAPSGTVGSNDTRSACPLTEDNEDDDKSRSNFAKVHGYTSVFSSADQEQGNKTSKAAENHYL